ncbi:MAG: A24 family peptidase [Acidimicrobiia bacterium]|nr:A24 family peptidase [Acidimicrobiia bacterium]
MTLFETYASVPLQIAGAVGGALCSVVAIRLAQIVPGRMELETRPRPQWWWIAAACVGVAYGWIVANAFDSWALLPALLVFTAATLGLALIDLDHQLIPNRVLFPAIGVTAALLVLGALVEGTGGDLLRAAAGGFGYFAFLLLVAIVARGGFGMGDVKLAFLLGLMLAFASWSALLVGIIGSILLGGVASVLLLVLGRKGRKAKFAYGPYLVFGAWVALVWGQEIADWYMGA